MVKVLHFVTELEAGGTQLALYRLLAAMDRERFPPVVVCLYNGQGRAAQKLRALGIPVYDLRMPARWRLDALFRLLTLLRREKPEILHTRLFHANIPGRLLGRLAGIPVVISSEQSMGQEGRARRLLDRLTGGLADRVVCVSQAVANYAEEVIGLPAEKLLVIYNGVDLANFEGQPDKNQARRSLRLPEQGWLVGGLGRLDAVKGFPVLVEAFALLVRRHAQARLAIAGEGEQQEALAKQIEGLGLQGRAILLGHTDEAPGFLAALDALALPSYHEGLPNAVLEAMAAGLPVVASAVGGVPELILDRQTGLLVPPSDPAALAQAFSQLISDPQAAAQLGCAGRSRVEQSFSLQAMVERTEALYASLLAQKGLAE